MALPLACGVTYRADSRTFLNLYWAPEWTPPSYIVEADEVTLVKKKQKSKCKAMCTNAFTWKQLFVSGQIHYGFLWIHSFALHHCTSLDKIQILDNTVIVVLIGGAGGSIFFFFIYVHDIVLLSVSIRVSLFITRRDMSRVIILYDVLKKCLKKNTKVK